MKAYHQFLKQLKETMIDYGQTLKSVQSGEWVYFSVSLSPIASIDRSLPSMINMEVKKSVLDQVNQGKISRMEAFKKIKEQFISIYGPENPFSHFNFRQISVHQ